MFSLVVAAIFVGQVVSAHGPNCCTRVTGSCRQACEKTYDIISDPEMKQQRLLDVRNFCPPHLSYFWKCMNESRHEEDGKLWKVCCHEAASERCLRNCRAATAPTDLVHHCRRSDEIALHACVEKQERGELCCGKARSQECHLLCQKWLESPAHVTLAKLTSSCNEATTNCISQLSKSYVPLLHPQKYLHCCDRATSTECQETCRRSLRRRSSSLEIMESLKDPCGPPLLHGGEQALFQCLLEADSAAELSRGPDNHLAKLGLDGGRQACCYKASSPECRRLCLQTYSTEFSAKWEQFERRCLTPVDDSLAQCLDEIEEPCELGCEGLSYCSNFNNRPTELFRSCTATADLAAQHDADLWLRQGYIFPSQSNYQELYFKNISQCQPNKWRTIACIFQIKPCHQLSQTTRICHEDCMALLGECLDLERMNWKTSVKDVCSRLSPVDRQSYCIKLNTFQVPSESLYTDSVSRPCAENRCPASHVCQVNKTCPVGGDCQQYTCTLGCMLGELSQIVVPVGTYVQLPQFEKKSATSYRVCQCSQQGMLTHCHNLPNVEKHECIGANNGHGGMEHGSTYFMDCNVCSCSYGEITCSKKKCNMTGLGTTVSSKLTTLPCDCPLHYVPVCSWFGATFPNQCLMDCFDQGILANDFTAGSCQSKDPCTPSPCRSSEACIPRRRVCLHKVPTKNCPQYQCVRTDSCEFMPLDPVCDTEGVEHTNICHLLKRSKQLAYFGHCHSNCATEGEVCGVDGNTYSSECEANARYITVDYNGSCTTLGTITDIPKKQCSAAIECRPLSVSGCNSSFTPPGACCPICGGAIRILYSKRQMMRTLLELNDQHVEQQLTVESLLATLDREIRVSECALRGHLTIEMYILVMVVPRPPAPTPLQVDVCAREAEKLAILIQRSSPRLVSSLTASFLTAATIVHLPAPSAASRPLHSSSLIILLLLLLLSAFRL